MARPAHLSLPRLDSTNRTRPRRAALLLGTALAALCLRSAAADDNAKAPLRLSFRGAFQENAGKREPRPEVSAAIVKELGRLKNLEVFPLDCADDQSEKLCRLTNTSAIIDELVEKNLDWLARVLITQAEAPQPPPAPQCQVAVGLVRSEAEATPGAKILTEQRRSPPIECDAPAEVVAMHASLLLQAWIADRRPRNGGSEDPTAQAARRRRLSGQLNKASIALLAIGGGEVAAAGLLEIRIPGPEMVDKDNRLLRAPLYLPPAIGITVGVVGGVTLIGALGCYLAKRKLEKAPSNTARARLQLTQNP